MQRYVEDEVEVQIDRIECRQIGESAERRAAFRFDGVDKRNDFVHDSFVQDTVWLPKEKR